MTCEFQVVIFVFFIKIFLHVTFFMINKLQMSFIWIVSRTLKKVYIQIRCNNYFFFYRVYIHEAVLNKIKCLTTSPCLLSSWVLSGLIFKNIWMGSMVSLSLSTGFILDQDSNGVSVFLTLFLYCLKNQLILFKKILKTNVIFWIIWYLIFLIILIVP